ncbi:MAG: helix-turn-helix domain-containing protein [bacterium]|nr:helix-turn-helix domain-containing protein [bacterium]
MQAIVVLKIAAMTLFWYHALLLFARQRHTRVGVIGAVFLYCMGCYLVCTLTDDRPGYEWLRWIVLPGCISGPFFFWLFTRTLFDDNFRPRAIHWMIFIAVEGFTLAKHYRAPEFVFAAIESEAAAAAILRLFPQVFSLGFVAAALLTAYTGREEDLLESRRRLRSIFIITTGIYTVAVLFSEIALKQLERAPLVLEALHFTTLLGFNLYFGLRGLQFMDGALAASPPQKSRSESGEAEAADPELLAKLTAAMEGDEEAYREEGLTIRRLATRLNVQEYRLRRAINGALGFRNFSDFVNRYRVQAACEVLGDANQKDTPVIRIAMDLGFGSLAPFNRAFKSITGTTPTGYRRDALAASNPRASAEDENKRQKY